MVVNLVINHYDGGYQAGKYLKELGHKKEKGRFDEIEESWIYGVELKPDFSGIIGEPVALLCPPRSYTSGAQKQSVAHESEVPP